MNCPKHHRPVEDCIEHRLCLTSISLVEISGKLMSDNVPQDEADRIALDLYAREIKKQEEIF
jgi:hypothetical protein